MCAYLQAYVNSTAIPEKYLSLSLSVTEFWIENESQPHSPTSPTFVYWISGALAIFLIVVLCILILLLVLIIHKHRFAKAQKKVLTIFTATKHTPLSFEQLLNTTSLKDENSHSDLDRYSPTEIDGPSDAITTEPEEAIPDLYKLIRLYNITFEEKFRNRIVLPEEGINF